jgi:hypothetical protein
MNIFSPGPRFGVVAVLLWCCTSAAPIFSQQQQQQQQAPTAPAQPSTSQPQTSTDQTQTNTDSDSTSTPKQPASNSTPPKDDRLFWTLPNLLTVEDSSKQPPLTPGQKFKLVAQGTFDPIEFAYLAMVAGINQASNSNPTLGQGLVGYAKRYGLAFGDNTVGNFMTGAIYPVLLRQDPRYYQMGKGTFAHRAWYAGTRIFVTRADSGKTEFNFSEILGNATAAAASNIYHPGPRTLASNVDVWWTQIGWDAFAYEMKEFWPDIHHALHHPK